jgi:Xaa-Pro aminopeptidase
MRLDGISAHEFERRVSRLQAELARERIDLFIGYSSESESTTSRYLTGFWPFFDFAAVVVPAAGEPALVTGGPESYEFAKAFSHIPKIYINPLFVETSAPEWVPQVKSETFRQILPRLCRQPKKIGVGNWNIFPHTAFEEIRETFPGAEMVRADELLLRVQATKADVEIPLIIESYRITEEALKAALAQAGPQSQEWELEAAARSRMYELGAEGTSYPVWVCSGPNTVQSLCRSTDRRIGKNELVQLTFGAKYKSYCGNMCRPFAIGKMPGPARKLAEVALEAVHYSLGKIGPGIRSQEVYAGYYALLKKYGLEEHTLYGPAHGTGTSEVEGLWLSKSSAFEIRPGMLFNIDIWLSDGKYGLRYEDGVLVRPNGIQVLTSYRREVIEL